MKTALGAVAGLLFGAAIGWGVASTYTGPRAAGGGVNAAPSTGEPTGPVLQVDGVELSYEQLPTPIRSLLFDKQNDTYENAAAVLQQYGLQLALARAKDPSVKSDKLPPLDELLAVAKPDDNELKAVFEANKSRLPPNTSFDQVKGEIERFVRNQKVGEAMQAKAADLKASGRLRLLLPVPQGPIVDLQIDQHPSRGSSSATLTLAEASDYLCPHCQQMQEEIAATLKELDGKLRFVQINFSLRPDQLSGRLIRAAYCARQQSDELFWKYHEQAFKTAKDKGWHTTDADNPAAVAELAKAVGLDEAKFGACVDSDAAKEHVVRTNELLGDAGMSGTPTFFLNNRRIIHAVGGLKQQLIARIAAAGH